MAKPEIERPDPKGMRLGKIISELVDLSLREILSDSVNNTPKKYNPSCVNGKAAVRFRKDALYDELDRREQEYRLYKNKSNC